MSRFFKRALLAFMIAASLALPAGGVLAENVLDPVCVDNPEATLCQANSQSQTQTNNSIFGPNGILTKAAQLIALITGAVSVIMIIIGGFKYVLSNGDPNNVTSAKNTILYAIIGLVVALSAQAIISFVLVRL